MDGGTLSVQDLFWLEQEELDSNDNFFMPADTPPNCTRAYQHRKRMCKEGYDRALARLIQKQTKEMNDLRSTIAQSVDDALLPEKCPESYHHYISGPQYLRQKKELFIQAMEFVRHNGDKIDDSTPNIKDMATKDEAAIAYKKNSQIIIDNATRILQLKHQQQRNQLLLELEDEIQKIIHEQNQEPGSSELSPTMRRLELPSSPNQQQQQQHYNQHHQQQRQQSYRHYHQRQSPYQQHQHQPIIHSTNVSRDPRIRPGYNTPYNKDPRKSSRPPS